MTLEICTHRWERESEHVRRCAWCGLEDDQTPPARVEVERLRARLSEAEDRCDEHVAHVVEISDVLDAEDGETALEAAKRVMRKLEAATNLIAHTAARVARLEKQVAALKAALSEMLALYPSPKDCEAIAPRKGSKIVFGFRQYTGKSLTDKQIIEIHSLLGDT